MKAVEFSPTLKLLKFIVGATEISDVFTIMGLILQGTGLFFFWGTGPAMAIIGTELLALGVFGKK